MARAWAAAQHDTAFVTLSLSKGEAAATRVTPVTLSLSKGEAAATRVTPVTLSLSVCHERRFHCKDLLLYER